MQPRLSVLLLIAAATAVIVPAQHAQAKPGRHGTAWHIQKPGPNWGRPHHSRGWGSVHYSRGWGSPSRHHRGSANWQRPHRSHCPPPPPRCRPYRGPRYDSGFSVRIGTPHAGVRFGACN